MRSIFCSFVSFAADLYSELLNIDMAWLNGLSRFISFFDNKYLLDGKNMGKYLYRHNQGNGLENQNFFLIPNDNRTNSSTLIPYFIS